MTIEPGFRLRPPPEPLPEGDPLLVGRIRTEIVADGPMTFARFMELALYDPQGGYYRSGEARPGREGDFLTAPETDPIFGHTLARALAEMWQALGRPDPFTLREFGAGAGTLALAILEGLRADDAGLLGALRYEPVELGEPRLAELGSRLAAAGFRAVLAPRRPPEEGTGARIVGCILANEFLDALPVHRVEQHGGRLAELYVDWEERGPDAPRPDRTSLVAATADAATPGPAVAEPAPSAGGRFVERPGPPSTPALAARLAAEGVVLAEGQRAEICLGIDRWIDEVAGALARGFVLVIDYGHPAPDLYGPERRSGTLRAYVRHTVGADPFVRVGRQDLTAHVDITAVTAGGERAGLSVLGVTTQAEFLVGTGVGELLASVQGDPSTTFARYLQLRASLTRMLDPSATGGFRVVVLGRDVPPDTSLRGLSFRLRR